MPPPPQELPALSVDPQALTEAEQGPQLQEQQATEQPAVPHTAEPQAASPALNQVPHTANPVHQVSPQPAKATAQAAVATVLLQPEPPEQLAHHQRVDLADQVLELQVLPITTSRPKDIEQ